MDALKYNYDSLYMVLMYQALRDINKLDCIEYKRHYSRIVQIKLDPAVSGNNGRNPCAVEFGKMFTWSSYYPR